MSHVVRALIRIMSHVVRALIRIMPHVVRALIRIMSRSTFVPQMCCHPI